MVEHLNFFKMQTSNKNILKKSSDFVFLNPSQILWKTVFAKLFLIYTPGVSPNPENKNLKKIFFKNLISRNSWQILWKKVFHQKNVVNKSVLLNASEILWKQFFTNLFSSTTRPSKKSPQS